MKLEAIITKLKELIDGNKRAIDLNTHDVTDLKDLVFKPGDTYSGLFHGAGFITNGGSQFNGSIILPKLVSSDVTKISATGSANLRQAGAYIYGSSSGYATLHDITVTRRGNVSISEKFNSAQNNSACGMDLKLTLTFI